ncbi:DMT family transporter [Enorma sp.]|uniref:DMT family transporter n=1 Tax=Enorma sp. TaxID=1920692 RepID=UPI003AB30D2D
MSKNDLGSASAPQEPEGFFGADAPVDIEDRAPGARLRGAGARSPLFWKLMLAAMAVMWGYSFFVMKDVLDTVPTFTLLACRFLASALVMLALFRKRIARHFNARNITVGVAMGASLGIAYALQTLGLVETTAGKSAFLTGTYCILVPFISYFMAREPLTRFNLGAALLCLAGIALVALDSLVVNRGDALTLVGAVFFALQIATAARYGRELDVNVITFWMFLTVGVMDAVAALAVEPPITSIAWSPVVIATIAFLALFCTCIGMLVQNLALAHVPPATGSLLLSLESPSGVLFSVLLASEVLTGRLVAGFVLIFCSIVLSETHLSFLRPLLLRPARNR